jgi:23S rRNA (uracil1939-C5)-methyltransferase
MKQHSKIARGVKPIIGEERVVEVQGMGSFGEGIASDQGWDIFIPKTTVKDKVKIKVIEEKKGRFRGELLNIIEPSPLRRPPRCEHYAECGGCDFQHIPYHEQMAWKVRQTKHWIRRSPLEPFLNGIQFDEIASDSEFGYRHRVRLQIKDHQLHFFRPHSHRLLKLNECPILAPGFFEALQMRASQEGDQKDWNQSFRNEQLVDLHSYYDLDGNRIHFDSSCFTQANPSVNERIWDRIKEDIHALQSHRLGLDLYCGIGNFTVPMSKYFEGVIGVESYEPSVTWARKNSSTIDWRLGETAAVLMNLEKERRIFDFVLLDPPRAGALDACRIIGRLRPPKIVYVSCSLESLITDLTHLCKKQSYKITRWTTADMFPQTHHIESIVTLVPQ